MKLPFPDWILKTPIKVYQETQGENGLDETLLFDGKCCYEDKTRQVLDAERRLVTLSGKAIFKGDLNPGQLIEGYIQVGEVKKTIFRTSRPLNPDGTVFSTELELM